jgi:hypothetical protein
MAYVKTIVSDSVVQRLIEAQGIYQLCNRTFDSLVQQGASSIDVPNLPGLIVKTEGSAANHADRKRTKTDTSMVNVPFEKAVIPIADEVAGRWESNGMLLKEFTISAAQTFQQYFDSRVIEVAQTTNQTIDAVPALDWGVFGKIKAKFLKNKVPNRNIVICIPAERAEEFYAIDVVKNAAAYNKEYMETGTFMNVLGMKFFISGLVPQVSSKDTITAFFGPGLAFVLNKYMELKQGWDGQYLVDVNDLLCYFAPKLLDNKFAVTCAID